MDKRDLAIIKKMQASHNYLVREISNLWGFQKNFQIKIVAPKYTMQPIKEFVFLIGGIINTKGSMIIKVETWTVSRNFAVRELRLFGLPELDIYRMVAPTASCDRVLLSQVTLARNDGSINDIGIGAYTYNTCLPDNYSCGSHVCLNTKVGASREATYRAFASIHYNSQ